MATLPFLIDHSEGSGSFQLTAPLDSLRANRLTADATARAAARAKPRALLAADLPHRSYETAEEALKNAKRLVAAGAEAVKAEGGRAILEQVKVIVSAGIPFLGHLGMLPQHVREEGGYHIKGKVEAEKQALLADAEALVEAGAFAIVLELVTPPVARELSQRIPIPTIGIGAGPDCDGQILVTPDLLGMLPWYSLKHVKPKLNAAEQMRTVVADWKKSVETPKASKPLSSSVPL
jgi:3-methyl-2-oxobutanoate hydroxymethyltransferase